MFFQLPPRPLNLAFFGTPELAATILSALIERGSDPVRLCVCQPDRQKGRGKKLAPPPVKVLALQQNIPLLQPEKMKDGRVASALREHLIDLAVVAAFGRILPDDILAAPTFRCWNVHASLLPRHRGASPIQHAILAGDVETGVTLMQMTAGLDEGPMLLERRITIGAEERASELSLRLAELGAKTLVEGLEIARAQGLSVQEQDHAQATFAPLIDKAAGRLDLLEPIEILARRVRAFYPWPGAFLAANDHTLKIHRARATPSPAAAPIGTIVEAGDVIRIAANGGTLDLLEVQPAGKNPMVARAFLQGAGRHFRAGIPIAQALTS